MSDDCEGLLDLLNRCNDIEQQWFTERARWAGLTLGAPSLEEALRIAFEAIWDWSWDEPPDVHRTGRTT